MLFIKKYLFPFLPNYLDIHIGSAIPINPDDWSSFVYEMHNTLASSALEHFVSAAKRCNNCFRRCDTEDSARTVSQEARKQVCAEQWADHCTF